MLQFLPSELKNALRFVNGNYLTEIRLRRGQPVILEYRGEYKYINAGGVSERADGAIVCGDVSQVLNAAMGGDVFSYNEQIKNGFITVNHGVRIGVAGEYVTESGEVKCVKSVTSLNIRLPHEVTGCSYEVFKALFGGVNLPSILIFSPPGYGKTTMLRDMALNMSNIKKVNVLVFDERREISGMDSEGRGYDLGDRTDVIRCSDKLSAIKSAIRAMKPKVIITDELYGEKDMQAAAYARDCGICLLASSHVCDCRILKTMPFDYFVKLTGIGEPPIIYDKNFNSCGDYSPFNVDRLCPGG